MMNVVLFSSILVILAASYNSSGYVPIAPFLASQREVGVLLSAQGIGSFLALVPAGRAVDKFGSISVLKQGMLILTTSIVLSAISANFVVQLIGRISNGVGGSVAFNAAMSMIMERFQEPARGEYIGTALGIGTMGNLIGPPVAGNAMALSRMYNFSLPLAAPFLLPLLLLFAGYMALLRVPASGRTSDKEQALVEASGTEEMTWYEQFLGVYLAVGWKAMAIAAVLMNLFGASNALLPAGVLEMHEQGFSVIAMGITPIPASLAQMILARLGGRVCRTHGQRVFVMIASPFFLALGLGVLAGSSLFIAGHLALKVVIAVLFSTASMAIVDAPTISAMAELASMHGRGYGEVVTSTELAVTAGAALGPSLGVAVVQFAGFDGLCMILAATSLAVSTSCLLLLR